MKNTAIELDVDFIGGQAVLTKAEENALSEYFKQKKTKIQTTKSRIKKPTKRKLEKI